MFSIIVLELEQLFFVVIEVSYNHKHTTAYETMKTASKIPK